MPQLRRLAYTIRKRVQAKINKYNEAHFGWVKFQAETSAIKKIKEELETKETIVRFIIVKTVKENTFSFNKTAPAYKPETKDVETAPAQPEKVFASQEEIDKSIDDLITAIE